MLIEYHNKNMQNTVEVNIVEGQVIDTTPLSHRVLQVTIDLGKAPFAYKAGQFTAIQPIGAHVDPKLWNYYSIASAPDRNNTIQLCISTSNKSLVSEFDPVQVFCKGNTIKLKPAMGVFTLPESLSKNLIFITTGTGIAPVRSMLQELQANRGFNNAIHLVFGARNKEEILYRDELEALSKAFENFNYSVVLSKDEDWQGYKGYVDTAYLDLFTKADKNAVVYLCGWPEMVKKGIRDFVDVLGFDQDQLVYELYS